MRTLDFSRGHAAIDFNNAKAELLGGEGAGWAAMESLLDRAAVLFAWEQVGLADAALNQARDYAMSRMRLVDPLPRTGDKTQVSGYVCQEHAGAQQLLLRCLGLGQRQLRTCPGSSNRSGWVYSGVGACR